MQKKYLNFFLGCCILCLQPSIWYGKGSLKEIINLRTDIKQELVTIQQLQLQNQEIIAHINYLKSFPEAIEEYARFKLGMIKEEETYYQVLTSVR